MRLLSTKLYKVALYNSLSLKPASTVNTDKIATMIKKPHSKKSYGNLKTETSRSFVGVVIGVVDGRSPLVNDVIVKQDGFSMQVAGTSQKGSYSTSIVLSSNTKTFYNILTFYRTGIKTPTVSVKEIGSRIIFNTDGFVGGNMTFVIIVIV